MVNHTTVFVLLVNANLNEDETEIEGVFTTLAVAQAAAFPSGHQPQWLTRSGVTYVNMPDDSYYEIQEHSLI